MSTLIDRVRIARRFHKSIRIDTDLGLVSSLEGLLCPQSFANAILTMVRHISETEQGAFTWTGPYGSGKSSLVVGLSALLNSDVKLRNKAAEVFGKELTAAVSKTLPNGVNGWRVLPVVARRSDPIAVIGEALKRAGIRSRKPRGGWNETNLISILTKVSSASGHGGLIIFIDEMGKFLESAAQDGSDLYIIQELAEAASRSNRRLLLVGVLHQAFDEYTHRLSHEMRDEWAKLQGRFIDLTVDTGTAEQIDLINNAIDSDHQSQAFYALASAVAECVHRSRIGDKERLRGALEGCWPLHPVVACLLGPVSRRRFGQNQRSIFGFLNSSEPHGFQDFLKHAAPTELYGPDRLWNYLRVNLEPSILASPDGHRWALASEALERCEAVGGDALHLGLLKAIGVIDLFKERSGLFANSEILRTCFPKSSDSDIQEALAQLDTWSLTIFKRFLQARSIFAGSDFDIDQTVRSEISEIHELDFKLLGRLAGLQPVLAKRHYHDTGALRWFDVNIVPIHSLIESAADKPKNGAIGQFLLGIPTEGENKEQAADVSRMAAGLGTEWDTVVGVSKYSWEVVPLARELLALDRIASDHPDLTGDSVARREVSARLVSVQALVETNLRKAFDDASWFRRHHNPRRLRHASLNSVASDLADLRFSESPRLHNELLNRAKPSSNAIAAQNNLLRHMVLNEGMPRLGIQGFPPERGLFESILHRTGLYARNGDTWCFVSPKKHEVDHWHLTPIWNLATDYIKMHANRTVAISEILDEWRKPPFGVRNGLLPILSVAFILSQRGNIAIYRNGVFRATFNDVDVDYLAKDETFIQLRWMELSGTMRRLLSSMAQVVRDFDGDNQLIDLEPIDVGRGLVAIYDRLPKWAKRTMRLSSNALKVRDIFRRARDPNRFLFDDIPETFRQDTLNPEGDAADFHRVIIRLREGLEELSQAYPTMLNRLRDIMLTELQVPNLSPQALAELRDRVQSIRQFTGDFRLEAFVGRLLQFHEAAECFEGIASLAANKPPHDWVDADIDRAAIELAELAQKFLRAETYVRVEGRPVKRHAMAVVIGLDDQSAPMLREFEIADSDYAAVDNLAERIAATLTESGVGRDSIILAALVRISLNYIQVSSNATGSETLEGRNEQ